MFGLLRRKIVKERERGRKREERIKKLRKNLKRHGTQVWLTYFCASVVDGS